VQFDGVQPPDLQSHEHQARNASGATPAAANPFEKPNAATQGAPRETAKNCMYCLSQKEDQM
jgi:hypothetical protein